LLRVTACTVRILLMSKTKNKSKGKRLTEAIKKQLYADSALNESTHKELSKKYGLHTRTIENHQRKHNQRRKEPNVLELKKALEVGKADSMMVFLMEEMVDAVKEMKTGDDRVKPDKRLRVLRETSMAILNIRNALAFTEIPAGSEDYTEGDIEIVEYLLSIIPENKRTEVHARITKNGTKDSTAARQGTDAQGRV